MAFTLAVAGKGGTGKTTLAALLIQTLIERGEGPVLAVDADPNPNLGFVLGCKVEKTISELRDDLLDHIRKLPAGVTKDDYLEMGIQECLWEGRGVDLLVMGAGEGPRCYCAVNNVLRRCIDRLRGAYRYVVMDNEAGLEHLSEMHNPGCRCAPGCKQRPARFAASGFEDSRADQEVGVAYRRAIPGPQRCRSGWGRKGKWRRAFTRAANGPQVARRSAVGQPLARTEPDGGTGESTGGGFAGPAQLAGIARSGPVARASSRLGVSF